MPIPFPQVIPGILTALLEIWKESRNVEKFQRALKTAVLAISCKKNVENRKLR